MSAFSFCALHIVRRQIKKKKWEQYLNFWGGVAGTISEVVSRRELEITLCAVRIILSDLGELCIGGDTGRKIVHIGPEVEICTTQHFIGPGFEVFTAQQDFGKGPKICPIDHIGMPAGCGQIVGPLIKPCSLVKSPNPGPA